MREIPVKKAGEILGETDHKLWRALFGHVDAAWAALNWENVVWVGADEMNRKKGHNYLTVFADLEARRVLLAVEGKDASVWERFAQELRAHNGHPKAITQVAIDMSPAYTHGVKDNLGNAAIVFDKFHVVTRVTEAVEEVRRKETRQDASAREPRWLDRAGGCALGTAERQTAGDRLGLCNAAGVAEGIRLGHSGHGAEPVCGLVPMGAHGSPSPGQRTAGAHAQGRRRIRAILM
jgi:hypothetical protein